MRLIDADALTEVLNVKKTCEDCDYQQGMFCSKSSDFVNACEAIFDAPTIEPEPHWIPCSERLPETDGRYLTIRKLRSCEIIGINTYTTNLNSIDKYIFRECKSGFYSYDSEYGYYPETNIIAWMPLPDPYYGADMRGDNYEK